MANSAGMALPALCLMFNAFVWGVSWYPFRLLQDQGLHPLWSTALIYAFSLLVLIAARPGAWRGLAGHPLMWLLAAAAGLTNVSFNWAVTVGDVVRVVLLFYLMPAWTVLLAWLMLGVRPTAGALARVALALAGVAVVLQAGEKGWPLPQGLPDWLAIAGGFSFALTNILLRKLHAAPAEARVLAMFGGGTLMAAATALFGMAHAGVTAPLLLPAAGLAIAAGLAVGFLAGNIALQYGASRLHAHTTSLIMLSEVVFASVSSILVGAAQPSQATWAGGALILAAAGWSALKSAE